VQTGIGDACFRQIMKKAIVCVGRYGRLPTCVHRFDFADDIVRVDFDFSHKKSPFQPAVLAAANNIIHNIVLKNSIFNARKLYNSSNFLCKFARGRMR
jgi:hypothetical protein